MHISDFPIMCGSTPHREESEADREAVMVIPDLDADTTSDFDVEVDYGDLG